MPQSPVHTCAHTLLCVCVCVCVCVASIKISEPWWFSILKVHLCFSEGLSGQKPQKSVKPQYEQVNFHFLR